MDEAHPSAAGGGGADESVEDVALVEGAVVVVHCHLQHLLKHLRVHGLVYRTPPDVVRALRPGMLEKEEEEEEAKEEEEEEEEEEGGVRYTLCRLIDRLL